MEEHQSGSSEIRNYSEDKIKWTHPSHIFQRLLALFLMCLIGFGKYINNYYINNIFDEY